MQKFHSGKLHYITVIAHIHLKEYFYNWFGMIIKLGGRAHITIYWVTCWTVY